MRYSLERGKLSLKIATLVMAALLIINYFFNIPTSKDECILKHIDKAHTETSSKLIYKICQDKFKSE